MKIRRVPNSEISLRKGDETSTMLTGRCLGRDGAVFTTVTDIFIVEASME